MSAKVSQYEVLEVEIEWPGDKGASSSIKFKFPKDAPHEARIEINGITLPVKAVHQAMTVFQDRFPFAFEEKAE